jgi:glycosidase
VPLDFWEQVRRDLEEIKPVFMLAEWETRDLHHAAFDASYAWSWNSALHEIAHGRADLEPLRVYYAWNTRAWPRDSMRMTFVSNHDKNAWEGTEVEQFGEALDAAVVLSVVGEGIPMLYSGQESGHGRRLAFFEKDEITWGEHAQGELYRRLLALKKQHPALWNGAWGARMERVTHDHESTVLAFVRAQEVAGGTDRVFAAFNFSASDQVVTLADGPYPGRYERAVEGEGVVELSPGHQLRLGPWGYIVLTDGGG